MEEQQDDDNEEIIKGHFSKFREENWNDLLNLVFNFLYNDGDYDSWDLLDFLKDFFIFNNWEYAIFRNKIFNTGFINFVNMNGIETEVIYLNDFGIEKLKKHKTYLDYIAVKEKIKAGEEKYKRLESFPKRYWWLIAICAWVFGIVSTLIVELCKLKFLKEPTKLTQPTPVVIDTLLKHKYDSLIHDIYLRDSLNKIKDTSNQ